MVRRRRRAASPLKNLSIAELQALLDKKVAQQKKRLPSLNKRRAKLAVQLAAVESEITAIGAVKPKRGRPAKKAAKKRGRKPGRPAKKGTGTIRAKRGGKMTIAAAIHAVLEKAGKPMKGSEIRDAIIKQKLIRGRKKSFPAQVNMALTKHKEFRRKGRGIYTL